MFFNGLNWVSECITWCLCMRGIFFVVAVNPLEFGFAYFVARCDERESTRAALSAPKINSYTIFVCLLFVVAGIPFLVIFACAVLLQWSLVRLPPNIKHLHSSTYATHAQKYNAITKSILFTRYTHIKECLSLACIWFVCLFLLLLSNVFFLLLFGNCVCVLYGFFFGCCYSRFDIIEHGQNPNMCSACV